MIAFFGQQELPKDCEVSHNMYEFWFINGNIERVGTPKVLTRVDIDTVPECVR